jgi:tetratricopeptide (TPR) repeat protein
MLWLVLACVKPVALPAAASTGAVSSSPAAPGISHVAREHVLRAHMHQERGELEQAAASWKRAVLFDPDSPGLYLELGEVREQLGELEAARAWYEEAAVRGSDEAVQRLRALDQDPG